MKKKYSIGKFAEKIGKSVSTVRRWEKEGRIQSKRHLSGHRYFDESDVMKVLGKLPDKKKVVVYCRVSNAGQKEALVAQVQAMEQFCIASGIAVDEWIQEIGSGMDFKRKHFNELVDRILRGEIDNLLIAHKDRLTRFGFDLLDRLAQDYGGRITVVNQESLSPHQEIIEDLSLIVRAFSNRLAGIRKYKKQLQEDYPDILAKINHSE
jgi:predicted site-specific integrase-resolvase